MSNKNGAIHIFLVNPVHKTYNYTNYYSIPISTPFWCQEKKQAPLVIHYILKIKSVKLCRMWLVLWVGGEEGGWGGRGGSLLVVHPV